MKSELRLKPHSVLPGANVIEVVWNGRLVCTITGADGPGVRIISKFISQENPECSVEPAEPGNPGAMEIKFRLPPVG